MLNGIFGKWLREFVTLVLTQTVQAFLLAIVMIIIISCLGNANSDAEGNQAAGLLAIIALASFGKIELLVKNIFGVTSQFGDPSLSGGARGLTAGTLLAMRGGKRLLDNGTKLVDSHRKISEAKKGLTSLGPKPDLEDGVATSSTNSAIDSNLDAKNNVLNAAGEVAETSVKLQGLQDLSSLNQAIDRLSKTMEKSNGSSNDAKREKYEAMLKEGKDMRRSAIRENIAGTVGGMTGAIVGLAKGEDVLQTTLAGAGAGDAIGAGTAARKAQKIDYNNKMKKLQDNIEDMKKLSVEEYDAAIKDMENSMKQQGMKGVGARISFEYSNSTVGSAHRAIKNSQSNTRKRKVEAAKNLPDSNNVNNN